MASITHGDAETIVRWATFAPSILNIQPWRFEAGPDVIELVLDSTRRLPVLDPRDRARVLSAAPRSSTRSWRWRPVGLDPTSSCCPNPDVRISSRG